MNYTCHTESSTFLWYLRSILEFGSLVLNPRHYGLIDKIQRTFIRMIAFKLTLRELLVTNFENPFISSE